MGIFWGAFQQACEEEKVYMYKLYQFNYVKQFNIRDNLTKFN